VAHKCTTAPAAIPLITAGSAAGFFKTGFYVDYRNQAVGSRGREGQRLA
jgi:hypothetical protein